MNQVKGDLLEFYEEGKVDAIAHCCNCQGVMGSGIALTIKQDYPDAYAAYKQHEMDEGGLFLGTVSEWGGIYNLHAQDFYKKSNVDGDKLSDSHQSRFVDYEAMYQALEEVRDDMKVGRLGIPYKMGSERAGGDWNVIEAMIKSVFDGSNIEVIIVEYNKTRNA